MRFILILSSFLFYLNLSSQDDWDFENKENKNKLFLDTRVVNGHTVNTLEKKVLDFRITHRFGEIATNQSYRTLFGFDNSIMVFGDAKDMLQQLLKDLKDL